MDEIKVVQIRISYLLFCYVFPDAVEHIFGIRGCAGLKAGRHSPVDVQASLALGISRNGPASGRGTVCFRILQRNADLHRSGARHYGAFQAPKLVRILPDGNHDSAYLQSAQRKRVIFRDHGEYQSIQAIQ